MGRHHDAGLSGELNTKFHYTNNPYPKLQLKLLNGFLKSDTIITKCGHIDRKDQGRTALCYSVVPLRSAHKPIPYEDSKRMCQSNQIKSI